MYRVRNLHRGKLQRRREGEEEDGYDVMITLHENEY